MDEEVQKLRRQMHVSPKICVRLTFIIDVQKKVAALLGNPIPEPDPEENPDAAVSKLASDVGTSCGLPALNMPRASYYRDRRWVFAPKQPLCGLRQDAPLVQRTRNGPGASCTANASRIARPPLFMRRCSMKGSICARFAPCIGCSNKRANPANAATN